jgi:hypothetical protein
VALSSHHPTARCLHKQHPGQQGGGKRLPVPLGGEVPRVHPVVVLVAPPSPAVGGRLQQVVGVLHGVGVGAQVQVLGHHLLRGDGAATQQHLVVVRGVQEAVVVAGGQAVRLETPQAGVVRIRRHRAGGTCDGYRLMAWEGSKKQYCLSKAQ